MPRKINRRDPRNTKRNAEEGGTPEFWDNDIDSEVDDKWQSIIENILEIPKISTKNLIKLLRGRNNNVN